MSPQAIGSPSIDSKAAGKEIHEQKDIELAHNRSSSSLRRASQKQLCLIVRYKWLRLLLCNLYEVILGTKLSFLFPLVPLAIAADRLQLGNVSRMYVSLSHIYIYITISRSQQVQCLLFAGLGVHHKFAWSSTSCWTSRLCHWVTENLHGIYT